jgi:hypothetical protein
MASPADVGAQLLPVTDAVEANLGRRPGSSYFWHSTGFAEFETTSAGSVSPGTSVASPYARTVRVSVLPHCSQLYVMSSRLSPPPLLSIGRRVTVRMTTRFPRLGRGSIKFGRCEGVVIR